MKPATPKSARTALVIGGGAPNATLMGGALCAFIDHGVQFDVISTAGAGALMGLLYQAPKNGNPRQALKEWASNGVADLIYQWLPVNYKVFMKPGLGADMWRNWLHRDPFIQAVLEQSYKQSQFVGDSIQLWLQALTPATWSWNSQGLCAHVPFVEDMVDFSKVPAIDPAFYINAYNVTQHRMEIWDKQQLNVDHFRAALSFPFIYPPYKIGDSEYIEGAAIDTLNLKALLNDDEHKADPGLHQSVETIVVFDVLGSDHLIHTPRNLYDAWVQSIITPLVELTRDDLKLFQHLHNVDKHGHPKRKLLKVDLTRHIAPERWESVLDWSQTNLSELFDLGYAAGQTFVDEQSLDLLGT
ncbi:patatin-like phospholipase family protein [Burkholderiaceae bacterium DAT-1]|nr:patatin-like phospholipase family protein [Burkholderiaceae bacterium DAT-1]